MPGRSLSITPLPEGGGEMSIVPLRIHIIYNGGWPSRLMCNYGLSLSPLINTPGLPQGYVYS